MYADDPYLREDTNLARPSPDCREDQQRIELKTSLAPSSPPTVAQLLATTATAYLIDSSGTRISDSLVNVQTKPGCPLRALGADDVSGGRGAIGRAAYSDAIGALGNGTLEIVSLQALSKMIQVTATANVAASATFTVTSCTVLDDGQSPCAGGRTITIANWAQQLCSGAVATCLPDGSGNWFVIDAPCPPGGGCTS
jgi:hypothetical protein